jgi:hypothetical protein
MAFKVDVKSKPVTPVETQLQEVASTTDFTTYGLFTINKNINNWHNEEQHRCNQQACACITGYAANMYMYPSSESESEGSF